MKEREEQVTKRRQVMEKIVDVKVIGKRGLSYRGHSESVHTLGDEGTDHG